MPKELIYSCVIIGTTTVESTESSTEETGFCYCGGPEGDMVACDSKSCKYIWFHIKCLRLKSLPKTKSWFCPDCKVLQHN